MRYYTVRFHLGAGEHYLHWQIKEFSGKQRKILYINPSEHQLELHWCTLINKINVAKKVNEAGVKEVSGWIRCENVIVGRAADVRGLDQLFYNPIRDVHWRRSGDCGVWDDQTFSRLVTSGNRVFVRN